MELVSSLKTLCGVLLLAAAMVLSLPGIEVVRAEGPAVDASVSGPICSPDPSDLSRELALAEQVEAAKAALGAAQQSDPVVRGSGPRDATPASGIVVLNTRGYNYGSGAGPPR
jgi:hypothetical protein